jgi:hypothetical protein
MRERCSHSIYLVVRSENGKKQFEFEERPFNLLTGFAAIERWMNDKIKNPFVPCEITAVIKDQDRNKVYEIRDHETEYITCMTPIHAFCEMKLGIHYAPIVPKFHSFNKKF